MKHSLIAIILCLNGVAAAGELAGVRSYDDLLKRAPIKVTDDCSVRLGIEDESDLGPWDALYCLVDWKADAKGPRFSGAFSGEPLGPVLVQIVHSDRREVSQARQTGLQKLPIYSVVVPTTQPDRFEIRINDANGKLLASREVVVKERRPCYWHTFAGIARDQDRQFFSATLDSAAAYPRRGRLSEKTPTTQPAGESPLILSLVDKEFHLVSRAGKLLDWPDKTLLARWWVNGKPIVALPTTRPFAAQQEARGWKMSEEIKVRFGLPADLGSVRQGDVIALQILYCSGGFEVLRSDSQRMMHLQMMQDDGPQLLLSNRLEFKLTAELQGALPSK